MDWRFRTLGSKSALAAFGLIVGACTSPVEPMPLGDTGKADEAFATSHFSHIGAHVLERLMAAHHHSRGRVWNASVDSQVRADWLLQTPEVWGSAAEALSVPATCEAFDEACDWDFELYACETQEDCDRGGQCRTVEATVRTPGQPPDSLCVGHSAPLYEAMYAAIVKAEHYVDVAVLEPPDGRFSAAIRNALTYLDRAGRRVEVRMLFGHIPVPGHSTDVDEVLRSMTEYLPDDSGIRVTVGAYRSGFPSRNHTKIIAVDGRYLLQGGHNYWTDTYLSMNPIFDVSMQIEGTPARDAHLLLNELWAYTCGEGTLLGYNDYRQFPYDVDLCADSYQPLLETTASAGDIAVISLGRLANLGDNPADTGMIAMIDAAVDVVRISAQDIGPIRVGPISVASWPEPVLAALARAVVRGADIELILSSPGAAPGGSRSPGTYGNGWTPADVRDRIIGWLTEHPDAMGDSEMSARALVCAHVHAAALRFSNDDTWPDGTAIGNHAKFMIVDDQAFYIGAQNLYPSNNAEFGVIVDDAVVTADLLERYWVPAFSHSSRTVEACE